MSEIKKLIERLCPDGVEYKKLGELCDIKGRIGFRGYTRQDLVDESNGAISLSPSNIINGNLKFEKCTYVSWDKYYESPEIMAQEGDIVFTKTASVGKTALIKTLPKETTINPQLVLLKHIKCNNAFLSYFLKGDYFQNEVRKITGIGSVPNVPQSSLAAIEIPVPPIEVQSKIVEYLDNFTELEAELEAKLEAELEARRKQYEYYRNQLLTFDKVGGARFDVKWMKLREISMYAKERIDGNLLSTDNYVGVENLLKDKGGKTSSSSVPSGNAIKFIPGDILIGNIRPYLKKIWLANIIGGTNGDVLCIRVSRNDLVSSDYLYKCLSSDSFFNYDNSHAKGGKMPRGDKKAVMEYSIPIPQMEEQKRIVSILDRFEALTTDLQSGLPAEIEARRKQYEYYREQLLTFKRKTA